MLMAAFLLGEILQYQEVVAAWAACSPFSLSFTPRIPFLCLCYLFPYSLLPLCCPPPLATLYTPIEQKAHKVPSFFVQRLKFRQQNSATFGNKKHPKANGLTKEQWFPTLAQLFTHPFQMNYGRGFH